MTEERHGDEGAGWEWQQQLEEERRREEESRDWFRLWRETWKAWAEAPYKGEKLWPYS